MRFVYFCFALFLLRDRNRRTNQPTFVFIMATYIIFHYSKVTYSPRSQEAEFVCLFVFFCQSRYDARHRKPRRSVYALHLGGTGISPPDNFSSRSSSCSTTSGDIFYCSGSRQLNHSSFKLSTLLQAASRVRSASNVTVITRNLPHKLRVGKIENYP